MKKIEEKVINFIRDKELIHKDDKVLVAFSGGPDSVFLLFILNKFRRKLNINIAAFHLNHKLRGKEADDDEEFCSKFCLKFGIQFFSVRKNVRSFAIKNNISLEEAGREIRYKELKKYQKKYNFSKIATAHNSNDNSETVLLNLIKGTGIKGISGIPVKRDNIIRPVLNMKKEEILTYLSHHKIDSRIDASNFQNSYERNYLRNEIIPLIKKRLNNSLEDALFNSSEIFRKTASLIGKIVENHLREAVKFSENILEIDLNKLKLAEKELTGEIFKEAVERNFLIQVTYKDFLKFENLIYKETGKKIKLSGNLTGYKERDKIYITFNKEKQEFSPVIIKEGEEKKINGKSLLIKPVLSSTVIFNNDKNIEYISGNLAENYLIRRWQPGDKFYPIGLKGSKKISDFLNDLKISSYRKEEQLVLTNRGKIVWVIGLRIDDRFKITNKSKKVVQLCLNRNQNK